MLQSHILTRPTAMVLAVMLADIKSKNGVVYKKNLSKNQLFICQRLVKQLKLIEGELHFRMPGVNTKYSGELCNFPNLEA